MANHFETLPAHLTNLYLGNRFFGGLGTVVVMAAVGFWYAPVYTAARILLLLLLVLLLADIWRLYAAARGVRAERQLPRVLGLHDRETVEISVENGGKIPLYLEVTDELPAQLQERDHRLPAHVAAGERRRLTYTIVPYSRGEYAFGNLNVFLKTEWKLAERRLVLPQTQTVAVYPSIRQMNAFAASAAVSTPAAGRRQLRRLTKSYEFDQIKEYVRGDDFRSINWKATGRRAQLMVNQYEEERAQRIYCVIDKGRTMLMPFDGLSLLDYAINATLALSKVVLGREDRAGLLTFSDKLGDVVPATGRPGQLRRIMETLYRQREREGESDYDLLYYASRRFVGGRSLLLLFTNFESNYALDRVLPALRRIARSHRLLVVLFENTEVAELLEEPTGDVEDIYRKSTARHYLQQRQLMAARLSRNGIKALLTRPTDLTGAVIEEYLTIKGRGL